MAAALRAAVEAERRRRRVRLPKRRSDQDQEREEDTTPRDRTPSDRGVPGETARTPGAPRFVYGAVLGGVIGIIVAVVIFVVWFRDEGPIIDFVWPADGATGDARGQRFEAKIDYGQSGVATTADFVKRMVDFVVDGAEYVPEVRALNSDGTKVACRAGSDAGGWRSYLVLRRWGPAGQLDLHGHVHPGN